MCVGGGAFYFKILGPRANEDAALQFIKNKFERVNRQKARMIYVHMTCATDTKLVSKVFEVSHCLCVVCC